MFTEQSYLRGSLTIQTSSLIYHQDDTSDGSSSRNGERNSGMADIICSEELGFEPQVGMPDFGSKLEGLSATVQGSSTLAHERSS